MNKVKSFLFFSCVAILLCEQQAVAMVKKSMTEKCRVVNATPELIVLALVPTVWSLTNRYNVIYGEMGNFVLYELLPGQHIDLQNFENGGMKYDRVVWFTTGDKKGALEQSIEARKRNPSSVGYIPVNRETMICIGYQNKKFIQIKNINQGLQQSSEYLSVGNAVAKKICSGSVPQVVDAKLIN